MSWDVYPGEVVALLGDNGAGKSTLIKCISGVYQADEGEIFSRASRARFARPIDARKRGIETIYQDLALANNLDVGANIFLGREVKLRYFGGLIRTLDEDTMLSELQTALESLEIHFPNLSQPIESLSGGQRQAVAIARAVYWDAQADDHGRADQQPRRPGAAKVLELIRRLRDQGVPVILITHTLPDVFAVADRLMVMHRGRKVTEKKTVETSTQELVQYMVGALRRHTMSPCSARRSGKLWRVRTDPPWGDVMKRSMVNLIMQEADAFIRSFGFLLPPFAYWSLDEFRRRKVAASGIVANRLGWDITDFGAGNFDKLGLFLFTTRNGSAADLAAGRGKLYAEKIMIARRDQLTPMHRHNVKTEDIINRGGGKLVLELFMSDEKGGIDRKTEVVIEADGSARRLSAGGRLTLSPGESVTLLPGVWHSFVAEGKDVLIGEVSTVNDDMTDNVFEQPIGRFADIEEDEPPLHLLVSDYDTFLARACDV